MKISLDYDHTYTADVAFWNRVIADARRSGHEVICVTGRRTPPEHPEMIFPGIVVCAGPEFKRHAAAKAGHVVDVWIDDMPEMIAPTRILSFD